MNVKVLCTLCLLYACITTFFVFHLNSTARQDSYKSIIVLGNSPNINDRPNFILKSRLDKAIELYKSGYSKNLIFTGAVMNGSKSEAEMMKQYSIARGVLESDIIKEEVATSTVENIIFTQKIIDNSPNLLGGTNLILTSNFHVKRTRKICHALGIKNIEVVSGQNTFLSSLPLIPFLIIEELKWIIIQISNTL